MAPTRSFGSSYSEVMNDSVVGNSIAVARPVKARATMSTEASPAQADTSDPGMTNSAPSRNIRRRP